jgi:hypothetical protein
MDIIAPYSLLLCADVSYGLEAHRHGPKDNIKLLLVENPSGSSSSARA